jgi:hypothetical protein
MFRYCRLLTNVCQFQLQLTKGFNEAVIMSQDIGKNKNKVYKVVLTGGNVKPPKSYIHTRNMTISLGTEEVGCTHTWLQFLHPSQHV